MVKWLVFLVLLDMVEAKGDDLKNDLHEDFLPIR